jgi:hypothetical protein
MDPMRRSIFSLAAFGLLTAMMGCGHCMHGKCDCVDCHGGPVVQPSIGPHDQPVIHQTAGPGGDVIKIEKVDAPKEAPIAP